MSMRAFVAACVAAILIAACGVLALGAFQKSTGAAFSTNGARINPSWSWREVFRTSELGQTGTQGASGKDMSGAAAHLGPQACTETSGYEWIFVDFGEAHENAACMASQ
jgi:hypothetical protein